MIIILYLLENESRRTFSFFVFVVIRRRSDSSMENARGGRSVIVRYVRRVIVTFWLLFFFFFWIFQGLGFKEKASTRYATSLSTLNSTTGEQNIFLLLFPSVLALGGRADFSRGLCAARIDWKILDGIDDVTHTPHCNPSYGYVFEIRREFRRVWKSYTFSLLPLNNTFALTKN